MPSDLAKTNMKSRISDAAGVQLFSYVFIYVLGSFKCSLQSPITMLSSVGCDIRG